MEEISVDLTVITLEEFLSKYNDVARQIASKIPVGNKEMLSNLVLKILNDPDTKLVSIVGSRLGREIGFQQELKLMLWFISEKIAIVGNNIWARLSGGAFGSFPDNVRKDILSRKVHLVSMPETDFNGLTVKDIENSL